MPKKPCKECPFRKDRPISERLSFAMGYHIQHSREAQPCHMVLHANEKLTVEPCAGAEIVLGNRSRKSEGGHLVVDYVGQNREVVNEG